MYIFNETQMVNKSNPIDDLKNIVRHADSIFCLFKPIKNGADLQIMAMSDMMANILGYTQDEIEDISHKDMASKFEDYEYYVNKAINNRSITLESRINLSKDNVIDVRINSLKINFGREEYLLCYAIKKDNDLENAYNSYYLNNLELYKKIVEMMTDGVFVEKDEHIVYSNLSGASLMGEISRYNLIGKRISDYLTPESKNEWTELREGEELYKTSVTAIDHRCKRKSGKLMDLDISSIPIKYHDDDCVISVVRDITSKKICERNLKKAYEDKMKLISKMIDYDNQKTEFFSNISHEFKTPLNVILGSIQLMETYKATAKEHHNKSHYGHTGEHDIHMKVFKNLDIMKQNCYRLLRLINNLIDANKVDAEFVDMYFKESDIVKSVEDITLSIVEYANNRNIEILFDTNLEEKRMVFDAEKLERIMLNLLSNALKFTPNGGKISVSTIIQSENVKIIITDTGIGIPKTKIKHIFDRFEQVEHKKRNYEGSGIGLYLVKSLVELHDGNITVESDIDVGTKFIINLPTNLKPNFHDIVTKDKNESSIIERLIIEFSDIYSS